MWWGFPGGLAVTNLPAMQEPHETQVRSLGQEDPLEEGMATHSSILAWRIPGTEEPGRLQSIGSQKVGQDWSNLAAAAACMLNHLSCPTLCDSTDYSLPNSSVHGILQARILEWVAMPSSRESWPRDWTLISWSSCIAGGFFTAEPLGKPQFNHHTKLQAFRIFPEYLFILGLVFVCWDLEVN